MVVVDVGSAGAVAGGGAGGASGGGGLGVKDGELKGVSFLIFLSFWLALLSGS